MKIRKNTDHTLIVEDTPWLIGAFFILFVLIFSGVGLFMLLDGVWQGLIFLAIGAGMGPVMAYFIVRRVQVVFHRPEGWVEIRRANLLRRERVRHAIAEVSHAIVQRSQSEGKALRRVALVFEHGQSAGIHPLTLVYSSLGRPDEIARTINRWLAV